jgi:hypothetical protein
VADPSYTEAILPATNVSNKKLHGTNCYSPSKLNVFHQFFVFWNLQSRHKFNALDLQLRKALEGTRLVKHHHDVRFPAATGIVFVIPLGA